MSHDFKALGSKGTGYGGLETFPAPQGLLSVVLSSEEFTALCPVTGQPDFYSVTVECLKPAKCVESKSFKLLLHSLRSSGLFCEELACKLAAEVQLAVEPGVVKVTVVQRPRGGVLITAVSELGSTQ